VRIKQSRREILFKNFRNKKIRAQKMIVKHLFQEYSNFENFVIVVVIHFNPNHPYI